MEQALLERKETFRDSVISSLQQNGFNIVDEIDDGSLKIWGSLKMRESTCSQEKVDSILNEIRLAIAGIIHMSNPSASCLKSTDFLTITQNHGHDQTHLRWAIYLKDVKVINVTLFSHILAEMSRFWE